MTRKNEAEAPPPADRTAADLDALRVQIDKLDGQILDLANRRASIAAHIGKVKSQTGGEVFSAAREEAVLGNVRGANKGPLPEVTVLAMFRELISGCRSLQKVQRVAFLGPEYSYSHLAALERFGEGVEYNRVGSIAAVFEEVNRKHAHFGLVPLFNSTDGRIADTLDGFVRNPGIKICAEVRMRIHHNLLANCAQTDIRRVYSKAQALSQCRNWLSKNLPHASAHEVSSTSDAANLVRLEQNVAAVASRQAAVRFGIGVLFESIEDHPENETRFAVIGLHDSGRTGADKTAAMFHVPNKPGALADVLNIFATNRINLTWIESFPHKDIKGHYIFFVDFDGHAEDPRVKKVLKAVEAATDELSVLGSFPASGTKDD